MCVLPCHLPCLPYLQEYKSKFKWVWDGLEAKNGDEGPSSTLKVWTYHTSKTLISFHSLSHLSPLSSQPPDPPLPPPQLSALLPALTPEGRKTALSDLTKWAKGLPLARR